jgi:hypothetical protein
VRACEVKALEYSEPEIIQYPQRFESAAKLSGMGRRKRT